MGALLPHNLHARGHLLGELLIAAHQLFTFTHILHGCRHLQAKIQQGLFISRREGTGPLVDQLECSDAFTTSVDQWRTDEVICLVAARLVDLGVEAGIGIGIIHADRFAGLHNLPHNPLAVGQPQAAARDPQCRTGHQLMLIGIP